MKKALLFLFLVFAALRVSAYEGHGYIEVRLTNGQVDSIAVDGIYDITHSHYDLVGLEYPDFVSMIVKTDEFERKYLLSEVEKVVLPMETLTLANTLVESGSGKRRVIFQGTFPKKNNDGVLFKWQPDDHIYVHMGDQDTTYVTELDRIKEDSTWAWFNQIRVKKKEEPVYIYYPGESSQVYNKVKIARKQRQTKVDNTEHIRYSGDCATDVAEPQGGNVYTFNLQHHPAFFAFLTHNPRLPSVKLKSVTMIADQPISGTFDFNTSGIDLESVKGREDQNDTITLETPYFFDSGWKHTPRSLENAQDSTAAYMVVAPQRGANGGYLNFKFIFNVIDTLSRIDTTFVKKFKIKQLKPNTFYTIDAEVPDTLFSIVDLGIGDIKFAFRNVEAYFERSKVANYGGAFSYGEANTKNNYEGGVLRSNWGGGLIKKEFTDFYDAAYQRWRGCWRLPQISEIDTLFKYCQPPYSEEGPQWIEYNGVEGVLFTGPSGRRIFLPASDLSSNYWSVNRDWTEDSLWTDHSDGYGSWSTTYHNLKVLELDKNRNPVAYWGKKQMPDPGYARGVLEYSNYIKSNTSFDGSMMLMRHLGEYEEDKKNFAIKGIVRSVRPWPTKGTNPYLNETGFIFGTDSATLYFDESNEEFNKTWVPTDSLFKKTEFRPVDKHHIKLVDGAKSVAAYGGTPDGPDDAEIKVSLSGEEFLGYLDKHQKYYVREYFMIIDPETGHHDYYYATKATPIQGFFPHTDKINWKVGDESATFNAHVVGVSTEVVGYVGFILSDSIVTYPDNPGRVDYALPTLSTGKLYLSDQAASDGEELGGLHDNMKYSLTIGKGSKQNIPLENRYYFARAAFVSFSEDENGKKDTTCVYAPDDEVYILHPLDTIDLGLPSGILWSNLCVGAQFPEDENSNWEHWNTGPELNPLISDISGTTHDKSFNEWFGREGWTFAMPSKAEMDELMENCSFDHVTRFGRSVIRISGPNSKEVNGNGNVLYMPAYGGCYYGGQHASSWTSTRPMKDYVNAYWGMCTDKSYHGNFLRNMTSSDRIRPLQQVIGETKAGELIFVSTDTIGNNQKEPEKISFWGRELGVTPAMKTKYTSIVRGFLVDEEKWYEYGDKFGRDPAVSLPDTTKKQNIYNGLYSVLFPVSEIEKIDADKDYWYRAWICVNGEYFYGVPKLLPTTEIHMKHRDWEVHENTATLYSQLDGMVYVKNKKDARTGFIVGKTKDVDMDHYIWKAYADEADYGRDSENNLRIQDGLYHQVYPVAKDTIYWVCAFLEADTKTRLSEPKQFGLDYVDLGLPSKQLWANLSVGAGYPEDSCDYFSPGEAFIKAQPTDHAHYADSCYIGDEILYIWRSDLKHHYQSTDSVMLKQLVVPNQAGSKTYTVPYRGARRNTYANCNKNTGAWMRYSGTKNDAAYVNWGYRNQKFHDNVGGIYNPPTDYGDLFVEPNYDEWQELVTKCTWEETVEDEVNGWKVTGPNGNSIFLPLRGYRYSDIDWSYKGLDALHWNDHWGNNLVSGNYHVADTTVLMRYVRNGNSYNSDAFYHGHLVRPIARYNLPLTKTHDKLRDETLAYLATDTVTYLNERTAVALRGDFRINWPMDAAQYRLGFIIGDNKNVMIGDANTINATNVVRNGSQFFVVLDDANNLIGDKTYFYRFYLEILDSSLPYYNVGDNAEQHVYYANTDTFHLARMTTDEVEYKIYGTTAKMWGHVQGIMPGEATGGVQAGILLSYDRDKLTVDEPLIANGGKLIQNYDLSSQLVNYGKNGRLNVTYTIPDEAPDTTYYFRAYAIYDGKTHYGDVNVWGYEMVDLGLPSGKKWASINVDGANSLTGNNYNYIGNETHGVGNGYDPDAVYRTSGAGGISDPAHLKWVNVSRLSYQYEMEELIKECDWVADTIHNVPGSRVISKTNGRSIFLRNIIFQDGETPSNTHYTTQYNYMQLRETNDPLADHKGHFPYSLSAYGCNHQNLLRPVWESNIKLDNEHKDELLIRTDDAIIHTPAINKVTFFGSLLGVTQRRRGMPNNYQVPGVHHAGFIIGVDTLVAHQRDLTNENKKYFKYDFPKNNTVTTDSIFYYETANINFFKVDTTYWVRAYVQINDPATGAEQYFYGRSIKFVRQPNITTGDVDWKVGQQKATLYGSVVGFNSDVDLTGENAEGDLVDIDQVAKDARVGIIVGYKHDLQHDSPASEIDQSYDLGDLWNGNTNFSVTVDYKKDTTYYYRAFIYYNGKYRYGKTGRYGLEFVDLGLPMYWASINVGSRFAEDHSDQYSWGDTKTQSTYKFTDYRYYYATGDDEYNNLGNEIKGSIHDVAHVNWDYTWDEAEYGGRGQLWAMPSEEDLQMLVDSCVWTDSVSYAFNPAKNKYEDVKGFKVYSKKTGRSIFINSLETPEWDMKGVHLGHGGTRSGPWDYGPLWTSSRAPRERNAYGMEVGARDGETAKRLMKYHYRYHGHYVRPMAHINVVLPDHDNKKLSITTERTSWIAGASSATIYGCVLGLTSEVTGTYGFLIGPNKENLEVGKTGVTVQEVRSNSSVNGIFEYTLNELNNHRMYYFRAYLNIGGKYYYGVVSEFGIVEVDLGLPSGTKWANVNMGSWKEKDHGDFYAWGETSTKDMFSYGGYKYYDGLTNSMRELSTNISGNDTTDVASKTLGGLWRMAGDEEWDELMRECIWVNDTVGHIPGYRVKSKTNSNSIFLPTNYFDETNRDANYELETNEDGYKNHDNEETSYGFYWSSNRSTDFTKGREMQFCTDPEAIPIMVTDNARYRGNSIRAVIHPNTDDKFYLRTEDTDWRYEKDSVNFYAVALTKENLSWGTSYVGEDYEVGFVISKSQATTLQNDGTPYENDIKIVARPSKLGGSDFVAFMKPSQYSTLNFNDEIWYYRAWLIDKTDGNKVYNAPTSKQFGLQAINMGNGLQWANINVDAASPEQIGLNGVPSGKYAGVDPAFAEFGKSWRIPSEAEKQELLDETKYTWTNISGTEPLVIYGVQVWKVYDNNNPDNFIYLTSKDPSAWGFRAVSQYNIEVPGVGTAYLRTDSTDWRAGYADNNLYASLVGESDVLSGITERGFVLTPTAGTRPADGTAPSTFEMYYTALPEQVTASNFIVSMPALPVGTYYYRAYVKYGTEGSQYYYADEEKPVGIDFVDLGLPSGVKWANVNIGATASSDAGDLYAWGETDVKSTYTLNNYKHYNSVTKYKDIGADFSGNSTYDAATKMIDGTRMPTQTELAELKANCTWTAETLNGVDGYRVTSTKAGNTNSIFLPFDSYWTSTQYASDNSRAHDLNKNTQNNTSTFDMQTDLRYLGKMVRPVSSSITTLDATDVTKTTATINGVCSVTAENRTEVGFEWTTASNPTTGDWNTVSSTFAEGTVGSMSYDFTGLTEGNIYYYRAFVKMSGESTRKYGTTKYFTTKSTVSDTPTAVDMGMNLGVKWADRNVGANLPEVDGDYYAWGDTLTRQNYTKRMYSHFDYQNSVYKNISNNFSASVNDIATKQFNGCWRMPTADEMNELITKCTWTWATKEGVQGYWVESQSGEHQKIFLPAAGYRESIDTRENDTYGYYWSATMTGAPTGAYAQSLRFYSSSKTVSQGSGYGERYYGFSIRPVYQSNATVDGQDVFIRTDSIVYKADRTENKLYGSMLGLNSAEDGLIQGFVIGTTTIVDKDTKSIIKSQTATANGSYSMTLDDTDLQSLTVGDRYYVRAFVAKNGDYKYGDPIEMKDFTFFTDSVKWSLSNSGTLYAHVKATKPASGLEVGFVYSTVNGNVDANGCLTNGKRIVASFDTGEREKVFSATIDTIRVHTYYYQAYTRYDNTYHYGEVKSFGAKVVDLGLTSGVKWVDMNLGADREEGKGDNYRWGDIAPNQTGDYTVPEGQTYIGGTDYDAAHTRLGSTYRLPSIENINELLDECTWAWEVTGYRITSKKNGNSIFLPLGNYWTSLRGEGNSSQATKLDAETSNTHLTLTEARTAALMLRATLNTKGDMQGEGGNAGGGTIGGGGGGDNDE